MSMQREQGVAGFELEANLVVLDVEVNGRPGRFVLDTGAGATCLARDFAERAGIVASKSGAGCGAGGDVSMEAARIGRLVVAGLEEENAPCMLMDMEGLRRRIGLHIDGILGFSFLSRGTLTVDYPGRRVRFERPTSEPVAAPTCTG